MRYGYFDDAAREYVITTPKTLSLDQLPGQRAVLWPHVQYRRGYCFYQDARLRRVLRYVQQYPRGLQRPLFLYQGRRHRLEPRVEAHANAPGSLRVPPRHGVYAHHREKDGVSAEQLAFVPLTSTPSPSPSPHQRNLAGKPYAVFLVEFCLWNAQDDMLNFQRNFNTGEVEVEGSVLYHKTEYRERRNHYAFFSVNAPVDGLTRTWKPLPGCTKGCGGPRRW